MNPIAVVLLALGVASEVLAMVGVALAWDRLDRLHFAAATNTVGPLLIALAVLADGGPGAVAIRVWLIAIALMGLGPVSTHALGRAFGLRDRRIAGRIGPREGEA